MGEIMSKKIKQKNWKVYDRKVIFRTPWFQVIEEKLKKPSGFRGSYYIYEHKTGKDFVIVIAEDEEFFFLTKQWRATLKKYTLEFVAGAVGRDESYLVSSKRELVEETGLESDKWEYLGKCPVAPGHSSQYGRVYLASDVFPSKVKMKGEKGEKTQMVKVAKEEFLKMIRKGKINDGPTLSAFLLYLVKKGELDPETSSG